MAALVWGLDQKSLEEHLGIKEKVCGCQSVRMFWSNSSPLSILYSSLCSIQDSQGCSLRSWRAPSLCLQWYSSVRLIQKAPGQPTHWPQSLSADTGRSVLPLEASGLGGFSPSLAHFSSICWSEALGCVCVGKKM